MLNKILGLTVEELQAELMRLGRHCQWRLLEEKTGQLVYQTEFGPLTLSWSSLPSEQLGSCSFPRTSLSIEGSSAAIERLNEALRCLRAGG